MSAGHFWHHREGLPWGWWLRAGTRGLEDGRGAVWPDVRAAFWEGRLGMGSISLVSTEQQERLLRVLMDIDARGTSIHSTIQDLFVGDTDHWRFYMCWLSSVGLTDIPDKRTALYGRLSDEGRAAMLMLRTTRNPQWADLPMSDVIEGVRRAGLGAADIAREAALRAFEGGMTLLPHIFARERIGNSYLVTLTSIDPLERMPMRRVAWSASFREPGPRDDLFGWLAARVHRWEDWGRMVASHGARALSDHLLAVFVAEPIAAPGGDRMATAT